MFRNHGVEEVTADLSAAIHELRAVNPKLKVILTVSPVPLVATAEDAHVLVATTLSKSVLRVAAGTVAAREPDVAYFPSYEIITGPQARGRYFAEDLRSVTEEGVDRVMALFFEHATFGGESPCAPELGAPLSPRHVPGQYARRGRRPVRRGEAGPGRLSGARSVDVEKICRRAWASFKALRS